MSGRLDQKILTRSEVQKMLTQYRAGGRRIGFTSGVFDILHSGHVRYLEAAREQCDVLVVAINDDASVSANKGSTRPICTAAERAQVVAGLNSVDFVFIFSEQNNQVNIETIRPDLYLKAGDYDRARLTSADLVESYGGRVQLVPFVAGRSSTQIIDQIGNATLAEFISEPKPEVRPAIFVDRDGTLIEHVEYLHEPEKVKVLPGVFNALKRLKEHGFRIIMITNQPAIGLGYCTKEDFFRVNRVVLAAARAAGVLFDRVYVCPHSEAEQCRCRKPASGLIERAIRDLGVDLEHSFVIGDMTGDLMLAHNVGCRSVLVETGLAGKDQRYPVRPNIQVATLLEACEAIVALVPKINAIPKEKNPVAYRFDAAAAANRSAVWEAVGGVCGRLAHDFNNISGVMRGCVDLIRSKIKKQFGEGGSPCEKQLVILERAIEQSVLFTNKLRGYVRAGDIKKVKTDFGGLVQNVLGLVMPNNTVILPKEIFVEADLILLSSSIGNIIGAALCRGAQGAPPRIAVTVVGGSVELLVGFDATAEDIQKGLVGAEAQKEACKHEVGAGLGFELPLARAAIEKHGGTMRVEPRGMGSCEVIILLPTSD